MGRVGRAVLLLATAGSPACLELNPTYVDGATETDSAAVPTDDGSGEATGMSTESGAVACPDDEYEPNSFDSPTDASSNAIMAARLESADASDWYKSFLDPGGPAQVFARTPSIDLHVCFYAECEGGTSAVITKCDGEASVTPTFIAGCCGTSTVGVEYDCAGNPAITVYVKVDEGDDTCPVYDLEIGIAPPE